MAQDPIEFSEPSGGISIAAVVATAAAAGIAAFLIRRARRQPEPAPAETMTTTATDTLTDLLEQVQEVGNDLRSQTASRARDLLAGHALPELKPILLELLKDVHAYVDDGFRRVEAAIRAL